MSIGLRRTKRYSYIKEQWLGYSSYRRHLSAIRALPAWFLPRAVSLERGLYACWTKNLSPVALALLQKSRLQSRLPSEPEAVLFPHQSVLCRLESRLDENGVLLGAEAVVRPALYRLHSSLPLSFTRHQNKTGYPRSRSTPRSASDSRLHHWLLPP
jgi:hypothetical protein